MKKLLLMACAAMLSLGAAAQNVQFHYDFGHNLYKDLKKTSESDGRAPITTTVEMFRGDTWGSTYFFIDLDYNAGMKGAYWEISREICFWQESKLGWLSAHGRKKADEQLPVDGRMGHRLCEGLVHLLGLHRFLARVASVAEHEPHPALGASVLGKPAQDPRLG